MGVGDSKRRTLSAKGEIARASLCTSSATGCRVKDDGLEVVRCFARGNMLRCPITPSSRLREESAAMINKHGRSTVVSLALQAFEAFDPRF